MWIVCYCIMICECMCQGIKHGIYVQHMHIYIYKYAKHTRISRNNSHTQIVISSIMFAPPQVMAYLLSGIRHTQQIRTHTHTRTLYTNKHTIAHTHAHTLTHMHAHTQTHIHTQALASGQFPLGQLFDRTSPWTAYLDCLDVPQEGLPRLRKRCA